RVPSRPGTDRPERSRRHTSTTSISRRRSLQQLLPPLPLGSARADFFDLQSDPPARRAAYSRIADLQRNGLLVVGRDAGVKTHAKLSLSLLRGVAKNPPRFRLARGPFFGHFRVSPG